MLITSRHPLGIGIAVLTLLTGTLCSPAVADDNVAASITDALATITAPDADGDALLPAGTTLQRVAWAEHVLNIWLVLPSDAAGWQPSPAGVEAIQARLAEGRLADDSFGGLRVLLRHADDDQFKDLLAFVPRPPAPAAAPPPVDEAAAPVGPTLARGPVPAAPQPTGALSGVVVYAAAGHGWTAGSSSWYLQRPVVWDMVEDYGNIDQLNAFAEAVFRAGATVVPTRPVGWQPVEIVLDEDDPGVTYTGGWTDSTHSQYYENGVTVNGVSYRFATAASTESAVARYTPTLPHDDFYPVYTFVIASPNRARQTYRIQHSGGQSEVTVDHRDVGNGWVWLGNYHFETAGPSYVEITNASPDVGNVIVADAIRWGCGIGTVEPFGGGTQSGYARDEEAQRYWVETELGDNAVGFASGIWDLPGYNDGSDNVGAGARLAREMNQVPAGGVLSERWRRIYLEFHTNAAGGSARGQLCLITTSGATTYQQDFAETLADEIDADLLIVDNEFEHNWVDRFSPTYTSGYGAISTSNNSDEFDATIVELAFHDNETDAQLLRDPRVRAAMARASVHGIIRFLNGLPGSQVPLAFPPDTPRDFAVEDLGGGDVRLSWSPPLVDGARGDAATDYVIYQSDNGYGFGNPISVGNVTSHTLGGLPAGTTKHYRIAARNTGGESPPSEVLAVRRPSDSSPADVLIVNGFDRLRRQLNPVQIFTQPAGYVGAAIERQVARRSNARNYVVQHAAALAANDIGFASCANEAISGGQILLGDYAIVDWLLGNESVEDATFSATEQTLTTAYLSGGGALFCSGSDIGYDLVGQANGAAFMGNMLRADYVSDDANTFDLNGGAGGILNDLGPFGFGPADGAPYEVRSPDRLTPDTDAATCLDYIGGLGGDAGVQHTNETYNTVVFGVPFETIGDETDRTDIMGRVMGFLRNASGTLPFDRDEDSDVDMDDYALFRFCHAGPDTTYSSSHPCNEMDGDGDFDVDLADFGMMQTYFTGPLTP